MAIGEIVLVPSGGATGSLPYLAATRWNRLAAGSNGQVLTLASGLPSWAVRMPKGHMHGLRLRYSSATAVIVETGQCRNAADDGDLVLGSETTLSITTDASFSGSGTSGLDRKQLTGTVAQTIGNQNVTGTSTLFKSEFGVTADLTGTVATVATTTPAVVTGTGTKFLTEFAIDDLIYVTSSGGTFRAARRITAIASDTSLTVGTEWANTEGGCTIKRIENAVFYTSPTLVQSKVNVITSDTAMVSDGTPGATYSGQTAFTGNEVVSGAWYFPWLVSDGTNTIVILSTQRTTPFLSGITSKRLLFALTNNASGNLDFFGDHSVGDRMIATVPPSYWGLLSGGASATYVRRAWATLAPPGADAVYLHAGIVRANTAANNSQAIGYTSIDGSGQFHQLGSATNDNGEHDGISETTIGRIPYAVGKDPATYYKVADATSDSFYLAIAGWERSR